MQLPRNLSWIAVLLAGWPVQGAIIYVNDNATGANNGQNWANAYTSLANALSHAIIGDQVWVAEGVYGPISLPSGVKVYGGFAGNEGSPSASNPDTRRTYIRGGDHVVTSTGATSGTVLRGFWIENGSATQSGGGLHLSASDVRIVRCVFRNNLAAYGGGAAAVRNGGSPHFVNCKFYDNGASIGGGAVYVYNGSPLFVNCLFYGNDAPEGGGVFSAAGAPEFVNCTFALNTATHVKGRGGALFDGNGGAYARNCIFWDNAAGGSGPEIYHPSSAVTDVGWSDVEGGMPGTSNINANPFFVSPQSGDFRIPWGSPCKNQGSNSALVSDVWDLDWDGNLVEWVPRDLAMGTRILLSTVDMGAYEALTKIIGPPPDNQ